MIIQNSYRVKKNTMLLNYLSEMHSTLKKLKGKSSAFLKTSEKRFRI